MRRVPLPDCYAVHRLSDGRWEILTADDDPYRPPWQRVAVLPERRPPQPTPLKSRTKSRASKVRVLRAG